MSQEIKHLYATHRLIYKQYNISSQFLPTVFLRTRIPAWEFYFIVSLFTEFECGLCIKFLDKVILELQTDQKLNIKNNWNKLYILCCICIPFKYLGSVRSFMLLRRFLQYAHQGCFYLMKNTVKEQFCEILLQFKRYLNI